MPSVPLPQYDAYACCLPLAPEQESTFLDAARALLLDPDASGDGDVVAMDGSGGDGRSTTN